MTLPFLKLFMVNKKIKNNRSELANQGRVKNRCIDWKLPKHTSGCTNVYFQEWPARKPICLDEYCENHQNFHSEAPVHE